MFIFLFLFVWHKFICCDIHRSQVNHFMSCNKYIHFATSATLKIWHMAITPECPFMEKPLSPPCLHPFKNFFPTFISIFISVSILNIFPDTYFSNGSFLYHHQLNSFGGGEVHLTCVNLSSKNLELLFNFAKASFVIPNDFYYWAIPSVFQCHILGSGIQVSHFRPWYPRKCGSLADCMSLGDTIFRDWISSERSCCLALL